MKRRKNTTVLIIITISMFLVAVLGATFAYFATSEEVGNAINADVETAGKTYQFTAASNGTIEMNIAFNEMSEANVSSNVLKSDNATIDVSLASPNNETITTCTYDIVWVWDSNDMYTLPDVELPYTHTDNKVYNYEFSVAVDEANETDLSKLPIIDKKVILQSGVTIESNSVVETTKTHKIAAYIYNLPIEQTNLFGKSFKAHVTIDNLNCNMTDYTQTLAYHVINTVYKSDTNQANIAANKAGLYFHDRNLPNGAADNTYRYAGSDTDVNNYVCFEGDDCTNENNLYRIISVDSNTNQTKVIKATKLGQMAWNSTNQNIWEGSSLEIYLNGTYLTSLGYKASKIEETIWSVGGASSSDIRSKNVKAFMDVELNNSVPYKAKIGLMYASEYGFAALPVHWTNPLSNYSSSKGKDWMFIADYYSWTISRCSDFNNNVFYIYRDGHVIDNDGIGDFDSVDLDFFVLRPSFNLSSNVKIINAESSEVGSKANPMIIN